MAWFPNYYERRAWLERNGLPVIIQEARVTPDGFVAIYLSADDAVLLPSNANREWDLHITLGYTSDYPEGVAEVLRQHINAAWAGRSTCSTRSGSARAALCKSVPPTPSQRTRSSSGCTGTATTATVAGCGPASCTSVCKPGAADL